MATFVLPRAPEALPLASLPAGVGPVTLASLEQEVAQRVGPFALLATRSGGPNTLDVEVLKSTIDLGGWVDLYVLRREANQADDRVARVKSYDPTLGQLLVDRTYTTVALPDEPVELHHLDPATLRRGVRAGLRRTYCQYWLPLEAPDPDDPDAPTLPATGPVDLTEYSGGWLRLPQQVLDVVDPTLDAASVGGWRAYGHNGRAFLLLPGGMANAGVSVVASRDHFTLVNGAYTPDGPAHDDDLLDVDLFYSAAFAHIELWRIARPQLEAVAAEARQATQAEAAAEASREALKNAPWLFGGAGVRQTRVGPLWGLQGAGGRSTAPSLNGAWVNGPDGTEPPLSLATGASVRNGREAGEETP